MLAGLVSVGCVSPYYGTAQVEKGWHVDLGLAAVSYMNDGELSGIYYLGTPPSTPQFYGVRGDAEVRYGFNEYIQCHGRMGLGYGTFGKIHTYEYTPVGDNFLVDVAAGPQFALPMPFEKGGQISPALRIEACYGYGDFFALPTLLVGVGDPEFLTLGARFYVHPWVPGDAFVGVHIGRFNILAGMNLATIVHPDYHRVPLIGTIGIGYSIK
ncbi:hypothetical protein GF359_05635 [candidate division WOR-3 bacterium]|uniref:Uncharacterized protein n=1 Tax=candidate division WOR-3 bacterium TaxID=2052148 RepID=A0A9D5QCH2_UNCW3|nr:hypothetical protein [candidate division WOR-3 bacterium]MBD3364678.1 hypothetical protein [candidate division WOR-3 bacterium]